MDRTELRKRWIMGTVQPELFYIPWGHKRGGAIYLELKDDRGEDAYTTSVTIYCYTLMLYHDAYYDEDLERWVYVGDDHYKMYAFNEDTEWRFPVPDPSSWETLIPDFTVSPPTIEGTEITSVTASRIVLTFEEPQNYIEINNMFPGMYTITVGTSSSPNIHGWTYYPDYYTEYDSSHSVSHINGYCQIDKSMLFSGMSFNYIYNQQSPYQMLGYDFYCLTDKFKNNTMPIIGKYIPSVRLVFAWYDIDGITDIDIAGKYTNETKVSFPYYYRGNVPNPYFGVTGGITYSKVSTNCKKFLGMKLYVDSEYKGYVILQTFKIPLYNQGQRSDMHTYTESTNYGLHDYVDQGYSELYYPYDFPTNYRLCSYYTRFTDYTGSYYKNMTADILANGAQGYHPEAPYYHKTMVYLSDCSSISYGAGNNTDYTGQMVYVNYNLREYTHSISDVSKGTSGRANIYMTETTIDTTHGAKAIMNGTGMSPGAIEDNVTTQTSSFTYTQNITNIISTMLTKKNNNALLLWNEDSTILTTPSPIPYANTDEYYIIEDTSLEEINSYLQYWQYTTTTVEYDPTSE